MRRYQAAINTLHSIPGIFDDTARYTLEQLRYMRQNTSQNTASSSTQYGSDVRWMMPYLSGMTFV